MKNTKTKTLKTAAILLLLSAVTMSISLSCGSASEDDNGGGLAAAELTGVWLKIWDGETFDYDGDASEYTADAMILEIEENTYKFIFYYETRQVGGNRGTFSITDDEIEYSPEESWSIDELDWVTDTGPIPGMPASTDGTSLDLEFGESVIGLEKTEFSNPSGISRRWRYMDFETYELNLSTPENYSYSETGGDTSFSETGSWSASGEGTGYIRSVADYVNDAGTEFTDCEYEALMEYLLTSDDGDILTLTYPAGYIPFSVYIPD